MGHAVYQVAPGIFIEPQQRVLNDLFNQVEVALGKTEPFVTTPATGATSITVPVVMGTATYVIVLMLTWNTTWWVTAQSTTRFTVEFGTPAPAASTVRGLAIE